MVAVFGYQYLGDEARGWNTTIDDARWHRGCLDGIAATTRILGANVLDDEEFEGLHVQLFGNALTDQSWARYTMLVVMPLGLVWLMQDLSNQYLLAAHQSSRRLS